MSEIPEDSKTAEQVLAKATGINSWPLSVEVIAEAITAERERCVSRFMTATDLLAEGNHGLSIEQITFIAAAIRFEPKP